MADEITGPRGGTTTIDPQTGQVRKSFWLNEDEAEALRRGAFERRTSEVAIVRALIRREFDIED
ncbi:MAG: hypothetical protein AAGD06_23230 [Acidobacteriota bacterium]